MRKEIKLEKTIQNITIKAAYEEFKKIRTNDNLTRETMGYYDNVLHIFTTFYNSEHLCNEITQDVIQNYIFHLKTKETPLSSVTINSYLRGLRAILYFFMEKGFMPQYTIKLIKQEKKIKQTYNDYELALLLKKPNIKECSFAEYRNWVVSNYFLATGNRLSTVCNLKICDIDFANGEIVLTKTKNRRQQIIPLSFTLSRVLKEYLLYRKGDSEDFVFCNKFGGKMSKNTITSAIVYYNKKRGVSKTSIHIYRHTFAKNWILNGGDIFRLKSLLGHSTLDMVKEYVDMFGSDLKKDFDKFNPLDNFSEYQAERVNIKMAK